MEYLVITGAALIWQLKALQKKVKTQKKESLLSLIC
jgi:hypothetical protein